ncbi:MAG TPA: hypothetical protein VIF62_19260 [Labilithrix sp.]|jgi:hypothetical protein
MMRTLALAVSTLALWTSMSAQPHAIADACIPPIKCCRICTQGQACGNTCIAKDKQCHKGRGCACDVGDVCAEDP